MNAEPVTIYTNDERDHLIYELGFTLAKATKFFSGGLMDAEFDLSDPKQSEIAHGILAVLEEMVAASNKAKTHIQNLEHEQHTKS